MTIKSLKNSETTQIKIYVSIQSQWKNPVGI